MTANNTNTVSGPNDTSAADSKKILVLLGGKSGFLGLVSI